MMTQECGNCGKSFSTKMRRCPFCGVKRTKPVLRTVPLCPRCKIDTETNDFSGETIDICPSCFGLWLDTREFRKLTSQRHVILDQSIPYDEYQPPPRRNKVEYLPCPVCDDIMTPGNFKKISGVIINTCGDHGVWLDAGELDLIRAFVADGGLDRTQDHEITHNQEAIKSLDTRLSDVEFMQKLLHHWKFKRWMFSK